MAKHNDLGVLGESIASKYLQNKGFSIITTNFRTYYGEIDVIAEKSRELHFIEVKTVSRVTKQDTTDHHRPEDNVHYKKLERLYRTIEIYMSEQGMSDRKWKLMLITVKYDSVDKKALVKMLEIV